MAYRSILVLVVMAGAASSAWGQGALPFPGFQGTPEDQRACRPAVFKFCQSALPDTFRILQCLQTNRPRIGKACQAVLVNYGQ